MEASLSSTFSSTIISHTVPSPIFMQPSFPSTFSHLSSLFHTHPFPIIIYSTTTPGKLPIHPPSLPHPNSLTLILSPSLSIPLHPLFPHHHYLTLILFPILIYTTITSTTLLHASFLSTHSLPHPHYLTLILFLSLSKPLPYVSFPSIHSILLSAQPASSSFLPFTHNHRSGKLTENTSLH